MRGFLLKTIFTLLFVMASQGLFPYSIEKIQYFPRDSFVGDSVRIGIVVSLEAGEEVFLPGAYPVHETIEIKDITIAYEKDGASITIDLISWAPGESLLPPIDLQGIVLSSIPVFTASVLEEESFPVLRNVKPPLLLPGTRILFLVVVSGVVVILLIAFPGLRIFKRLKAVLRESKEKRKPYSTFKKQFNRLLGGISAMSPKEVYYAFSQAIKAYLSGKKRRNFYVKTSTELEEAFGYPSHNGETSHKSEICRLVEALKICDAVKFAGFLPDTDRILKDGLEIIKAAQAVEREGQLPWSS